MRVVLLLLALAGTVRAAGVAVEAGVEPERPGIGQPFRYTLDVTAPAGAEVEVAQPAERLGGFDVLDLGAEPEAVRDGRVRLRRWWRLVGWSPGEHVIESPPVRVRLPGEEPRDAGGDPTRVVIPSVLGDAGDAADIRDLKGPEPVPGDPRPYLLAGVALALLAGLAVAWRAWRGRRGAAPPAAPPRPAHEVAAEALRALRARRLPEAGEWKAFYSALSDIVRRYLEGRFAVRAPEMTTEEFLAATARGGALARDHRRLLGDFLAEADLVKFARHVPTLGDSARALAAAERFVDETAVRDRSPVEGARAAG